MSKRKVPQIIDPTRSDVKKLIGISILVKVVLVLITVFIMQSFIDTFAITYYAEKVAGIFNGEIPYVTYVLEYPILALIPMIIASIPAIILNDGLVYIISFILLMVACDCVTIYCIYKIALKVWANHKQAYIAGLLYVLAISVAYVTITEYAAFVTMLMMLGIMFTLYGGDRVKGYGSMFAGFFAKAFPAIALPFIILYISKQTSLKQELITCIKYGAIAVAILFIPFFLINPSNIDTYLFKINGQDREVYASSVIYMAYSWIHDVLNIAITQGMLIVLAKVVMVSVLAYLVYSYYKSQNTEAGLLIKYILLAIFTVVTLMQFHSPNYDSWYVPLICILAVDDIRKMALLMLSQLVAYIVFPLSFFSLWGNPSYTSAVGTPGWQLALLLFTIQFVILISLVWLVTNPKEMVYNAE
jgi:hypothetical protein